MLPPAKQSKDAAHRSRTRKHSLPACSLYRVQSAPGEHGGEAEDSEDSLQERISGVCHFWSPSFPLWIMSVLVIVVAVWDNTILGFLPFWLLFVFQRVYYTIKKANIQANGLGVKHLKRFWVDIVTRKDKNIIV